MAYPVRDVRQPAVLAGQTNGHLAAAILVETPGQLGGPTVRLVLPAARAWRALAAAATAAGHVLKATSVNDSYRPYEVQDQIFRERYTTSVLPGRPSTIWQGRRWYQKPNTAAAAVPGTSNHGLALAVDAGEERDGDPGTEDLSAAALAWLVAHEQEYGWSHELQSEPWHIRYWAGDQIPAAVLAYERGDDMPVFIRVNETGACWVANGATRYPLSTMDDLNEALAAWGKTVKDLRPVSAARLGAYGADTSPKPTTTLVITDAQLAAITTAAEHGGAQALAGGLTVTSTIHPASAG